VFLEELFRAFFPPIFWSRYSCEYKKSFLPILPTIFFPTFFARTILVFLEELFRRFFPHFFVMIFVEYKKIFRPFSGDIFPKISDRTIRVFLKNCFARFSPLFLVTILE